MPIFALKIKYEKSSAWYPTSSILYHYSWLDDSCSFKPSGDQKNDKQTLPKLHA